MADLSIRGQTADDVVVEPFNVTAMRCRICLTRDTDRDDRGRGSIDRIDEMFSKERKRDLDQEEQIFVRRKMEQRKVLWFLSRVFM